MPNFNAGWYIHVHVCVFSANHSTNFRERLTNLKNKVDVNQPTYNLQSFFHMIYVYKGLEFNLKAHL